MKEGAKLIWAISRDAISRQIAAGPRSRTSAQNTTQAPCSSGNSSWLTETLKPIEVEASTRAPGWSASCRPLRAAMRLTSARCGTPTPLGRPVVPDV